MTADETSPAKTSNIKISNNIIIGCRRSYTHYGHKEPSGLKNFIVENNTIIVPHAKGLNEKFIGINIPHNKGNNFNTVFRNNIVYGTHPDTYLLSLQTGNTGLDDDGGTDGSKHTGQGQCKISFSLEKIDGQRSWYHANQDWLANGASNY